MSIVQQIVSTSGNPYVTEDPDMNAVCNRQLRSFSARTRCLYNDQIAFTLDPGGSIPSNGIYDLRGDAFASQIAWVDFITIDGAPLYDLSDSHSPGLITLNDLLHLDSGYQVQGTGRPSRAIRLSPTSIRLYKVPDQAYSNCFAAGSVLHPDIATDASGDVVEVSIPEEFIECAAVFIAVGLINWSSNTESDYERMSYFNKGAAAQMQELIQQTESMRRDPVVRGRYRTRSIFNVG